MKIFVPRRLLSVILILPFYLMNSFAQVPAPPQGARDFFQQAERLINAGKPEDALAELRKAEELEPKRIEIQLQIGIVTAVLSRFEDSVSAFRKAIRIDPNAAFAHFGLCKALTDAKKRTEALDSCREAIRLDPKNAGFYTHLAEIHLLDKRSAEALSLLERAYPNFQNDIVLLGMLGDGHFRNGEYSRAAELYEKITRLAPELGVAYLKLSQSNSKLNRLNEAVAAARKYLELSPGIFAANLNLGGILQEAGFYQESIDFLLRATALKTDSGPAYLMLSNSYEAIGDRDNTVDSLRHAYKHLPPNFPISYRLGEALRNYGKMAESVAPLERALSLKPEDVQTMTGLALAYFESNEFEKGIKLLLKADSLKPNDLGIQMFLRVARGRQDMLGEFQQILDRVEQNPRDAQARLELASVYRYRHQLKEAEREHLAVIKISPKDFNGYNFLSIFYSDTGQIEKSLEYALKTAELNPHHVLYYGISDKLAKLGKIDDAITAIRKAIEIKPVFLPSHLHLGDLLLKKGKRDEALQAFQSAFALGTADPRPNFRLAWFYVKMGNKEGAVRHYEILKSIAPNEVKYLAKSMRAHFGV